ncbi:MAG: UvrD-helicase domain-containing protein, partial [Nakamurella sp.]
MTPAPQQFSEVPNFDVTATLPTDSTIVLEASAGTGKTHTIASLAARYLAEGHVRLEDMMLVTFGRMATQELRDRVRSRLVSIERSLADPAAAAASTDEVVTLLAGGTVAEVADRRNRLATALASFDEATIATTHSFCQRMLAGLGIAADSEAETTLLENSSDLLRQVADDEYLRRFAGIAHRPFSAEVGHRLATEAVGVAQARLEPADAAAGTPAKDRVDFAVGVRAAFDLRKRRGRLLDFDDLQLRLAEALGHPVRGESARQTLRAAYQVVLVDEFQDTDPVQWDILRLAFHGHRTLVLIGDPKQAIYAFRGADVFTYLDAAQAAGEQATLGTNWRSDAPLVRALDHLWGGLALGDNRIRVRPIEAQHTGSRLRLPARQAPIRIRQLKRWQADQSSNGLCQSSSARESVAKDLAAEVVELLQSGADISRHGEWQPIGPADIAVLVHTNKEGVQIRDALRALGVPVVLTGNTSVFDSAAARYWLTLLDALESPNRGGKVRAAALTPFIGWDADQLAGADAAAIDALGDQLREWASTHLSGGMAALLETVTVTAGIGARVLGMPDGDRLLTDIRHVAHALHSVARSDHLGPSALLEWLRRRIEESAGVDAGEELSRRLSSEDAAVQVITVHRSKGLEFGVVFV